MRRRITTALSQLTGLILILWPANAPARTLDRVAAVVGEHIVLLSEVQERAQPALRVLPAEKDPLAQAKATTKALYDACERLVDETLIEDAAAQAHITVTPEDINRAMSDVALRANLTMPGLLEAVAAQGFTLADYRQDIREQLLEWRLAQMRAGSGDQAKLDAAHKTMLTELRASTYVEVRLAP